jgi:Stage II sporulation protein M
MSNPDRLRDQAAAVAGVIAAATIAVALVVRLVAAEPTRRVLDFPFAGLVAGPETALSILAANLRLLVATLAAAVIVQSPWCVPRAGQRSAIGTLVVSALDALVALNSAFNVCVVGAALGAYGSRMAAAMLPHGPLELAAFALTLALYLRARQGPLAPRHLAAVAPSCVALLVVAAALETWVVP